MTPYLDKTIGEYAVKRLLEVTDFDVYTLDRVVRILIDCGVPGQLIELCVHRTQNLFVAYNVAPSQAAKAVGNECVAKA